MKANYVKPSLKIKEIDTAESMLDGSKGNNNFVLTNEKYTGGIGNTRGPVLGALFVVLLPEFLRFVGLPDTIASNLRQIIYLRYIIIIRFSNTFAANIGMFPVSTKGIPIFHALICNLYG